MHSGLGLEEFACPPQMAHVKKFPTWSIFLKINTSGNAIKNSNGREEPVQSLSNSSKQNESPFSLCPNAAIFIPVTAFITLYYPV